MAQVVSIDTFYFSCEAFIYSHMFPTSWILGNVMLKSVLAELHLKDTMRETGLKTSVAVIRQQKNSFHITKENKSRNLNNSASRFFRLITVTRQKEPNQAWRMIQKRKNKTKLLEKVFCQHMWQHRSVSESRTFFSKWWPTVPQQYSSMMWHHMHSENLPHEWFDRWETLE